MQESSRDRDLDFEQQLSWARKQMPLVKRGLSQLPDLRGVRLACSMHLEIKMIPLLEGLMDRGASVFLTTCNPKTVCGKTITYLNQKGATVEAWYGMSHADAESSYRKALLWEPTHLCEMGADLSVALSHSKNAHPNIRAGMEATGTGISRLKNIPLSYPIFNWDDVPLKEGIHNRHMVGVMTWHAFLNRTGLTLHGKRVAVIGYGLVGAGVAAMARAYGGSISVVEKDPVRAVKAGFAGWDVKTLDQALSESDVIVTATGCASVLRSEHFGKMKNGAFLINVGHHAVEIDIDALLKNPHQEVLPYVKEVMLGQNSVYLFAEGSMANLVAGKGDSYNAFDVILAIMIGGIQHIVGDGAKAAPGVHLLPMEKVTKTFL